MQSIAVLDLLALLWHWTGLGPSLALRVLPDFAFFVVVPALINPVNWICLQIKPVKNELITATHLSRAGLALSLIERLVCYCCEHQCGLVWASRCLADWHELVGMFWASVGSNQSWCVAARFSGSCDLFLVSVTPRKTCL